MYIITMSLYPMVRYPERVPDHWKLTIRDPSLDQSQISDQWHSETTRRFPGGFFWNWRKLEKLETSPFGFPIRSDESHIG